jgi:hypothetical protein
MDNTLHQTCRSGTLSAMKAHPLCSPNFAITCKRNFMLISLLFRSFRSAAIGIGHSMPLRRFPENPQQPCKPTLRSVHKWRAGESRSGPLTAAASAQSGRSAGQDSPAIYAGSNPLMTERLFGRAGDGGMQRFARFRYRPLVETADSIVNENPVGRSLASRSVARRQANI